MPFAEFLNTTPTPANISPKPPMPSDILAKASANFLSNAICITVVTPANTAPQSIFLNTSIILEPNSPRASNTFGAFLPSPLIKPCIVFSPTSSISVDGECIPKTPLIALRMDLPISINIPGIDVIPSLSPFLRPSIMFLPTSFKSMFLIFSKNCLT